MLTGVFFFLKCVKIYKNQCVIHKQYTSNTQEKWYLVQDFNSLVQDIDLTKKVPIRHQFFYNIQLWQSELLSWFGNVLYSHL